MSSLKSRVAASGIVLALTVGITATLSRPGHTSGGPIPVQVTGTTMTRDTDNPARQPFAQRLDIVLSGGAGNGNFIVPAGKRLVITYASCSAYAKAGASVSLDLATTVNGAEVEAHLPAADQGIIDGQQAYASSNLMDVTADPGSTVVFSVIDGDSTQQGGLIVGIYGYLITP